MRSRVLALSSLAVIAATGVVGGVTYALFSATSANTSNTFTAGTVAISNSNKTSWSANFDNMAPGDSVSKTVTVHNDGSLDLEFVTVPTRSGALFSGTGKASVVVSNGTGAVAPGGTQDVTASVSLPLSADNSYQTATGDLTLTFQAWQTRNITSRPATVTKTGTAGTWDIYRFADGATVIPLNTSGIIAFTEHRPDGSTISFEVDASSDPNFYFNNTRPAGTYTYEVMGKGGIKYTGTINHP